VTLTGTRAADGNLMLRRDQGVPPGTQVQPQDGNTAISVTVPDLNTGSNVLCLVSRDLAGNVSPEACVTIVRVDAPTVTIVSPLNGAVIRGMSLDVEVTAVGGATGPTAVASVDICFDTDCAAATAVGGMPNHYRRTVATPNLTTGSMHTVGGKATNAGGGVGTASATVTYDGTTVVLSSTNVPLNSQKPRFVLDASGNFHTVWQDTCANVAQCAWLNGTQLPDDIYYRKVSTNGVTPIKVVSNSTGDGESREPDIAIDASGTVHVVWQDRGDVNGKGNDADILHRTIDPNTGALGPVNVVTPDDPTLNLDDTAPSLAADPNGTMHLVWDQFDPTTNRHRVYYSTFKNNAWTMPILTSDPTTTGNSERPRIAVGADHCANVVWHHSGGTLPGGSDFDVYYRQVCAGNLSSIVLVSDNGLDGRSTLPVVAVDATGTTYIAWEDTTTAQGSGTDSDIWLRAYHGMTADPYVLVSSNSAFDSTQATLTVARDGRLVIGWAERIDVTNAEIQYVVSFDATLPTVFFTPLTATNTPKFSTGPQVLVDNALNLNVVWEDQSDYSASNAPQNATNDRTTVIFTTIPL